MLESVRGAFTSFFTPGVTTPRAAVTGEDQPPATPPMMGDVTDLHPAPAPTAGVETPVRFVPAELYGEVVKASAQGMPQEGRIAELLTSSPAPAPLSPEKLAGLREEMRVLDELGYLQKGDPDFPCRTDHKEAFERVQNNQPVYWRETPNSNPVHISNWQALEQAAQEARQRTYR